MKEGSEGRKEAKKERTFLEAYLEYTNVVLGGRYLDEGREGGREEGRKGGKGICVKAGKQRRKEGRKVGR